jgi:L-glutamine:2-deoxy-scyllo-inosose/3-amino-2,3-dideoxy-scyllo-inosose aminotransferase
VLALEGGTPAGQSLPHPVWPPRNEDTAKRLLDLYWRGTWSFNLDGQEEALCQEFSAAHDAAHGVFMANGTITLRCALGAYNIGAGDEVIVPALTCTTSITPVQSVGATSVFADVDPSTFCLDPSKVEAAITPRTRAIMPVHLYGAMSDMDALLVVARRHNLIVIEDCAHVPGGRWAGQGIGSLGHVGSFSFQQKKPISSGEGGMCITNDPEIAQRLHRMMHIGYAPGEYGTQAKTQPPVGLPCSNLSATEFQALIVRDQLARLPQQLETYEQNVAHLRTRLSAMEGMRVQAPGNRAAPQPYCKLMVICDQEPLADIPIGLLIRAICAEGLPVTPTYGAAYRHVTFNLAPREYVLPAGGCPVTDGPGSQRALTLNHPWLGLDQGGIQTIAEIFEKLARNADRLRELSRRSRTTGGGP